MLNLHDMHNQTLVEVSNTTCLKLLFLKEEIHAHLISHCQLMKSQRQLLWYKI